MANNPWPERIHREFVELQYQSELFVAGVQLGIITLLFVILLSAPIGYSPDAPVHSARLGLSLFTILVLLRLWLAMTHQLNKLLLSLFVVVEMSLLIFILWTYHLQFETTPLIDLKNAHFNFIFVLIALRSLRFEPQWVILSGLTAIVGWSIVLWQTVQEASMQAITWDYVTFASTRSIYLGAEFDRLLAIALVTIVLTFSLNRARKTLQEAVFERSAAKDLSQFFDKAVAQKITHAQDMVKAGYSETRQAAILFIDLRGFSKLSEKLPSSELLSLLSEYQHLLVPAIQKHQGNIDKFMGDGILASFGAVMPSQIYAKQALEAVDEILQVVDSWKSERAASGKVVLNVGMGLTIGEIMFGVIGIQNRLEYTIIGEAVNVAAKLEKHNKVEMVHGLATKFVLDLAKEQGYVEIKERELRKQRVISGIEEKLDIIVL